VTIVVCGRIHERYFVVDCVVCCGMKNLNALAVVGFHIPSRKALSYGMLNQELAALSSLPSDRCLFKLD
jgi:hypothetical protein